MIEVVVIGDSAEGKSAVAEVIRQALAEQGVKVNLLDDNGTGLVDERPGVIERSLDERIGWVREHTEVCIRTRISIPLNLDLKE